MVIRRNPCRGVPEFEKRRGKLEEKSALDAIFP
jgi:hypothetical protein